MDKKELDKLIDPLVDKLLVVPDTDIVERVAILNYIRSRVHEYSPFQNEPVDYVKWEYTDNVVANDYNPNKVAPPEMKLLELSIVNDGYTQPIVTWNNDKGVTEVIDGFHRNRVGKESELVCKRIQGFLPVVNIRKENSTKKQRMASTIRHNRARGKHQIDAMSEIVIELKNRNWKNKRIAKELGMDEEEVLRLCQISGLEHLFADADFSNAWLSNDEDISDWEPITDNLTDEQIAEVRTANTSDPNRIFHTYDKWECHKAGFFATKHETLKAEKCKEEYAKFLSDSPAFSKALTHIIANWKYSCEHYLTNPAMNRIAWLGQASACYALQIPSKFCSGFNLLTDDQKDIANNLALDALNEWLLKNDRDPVSMNEALSVGRQVEIY